MDAVQICSVVLAVAWVLAAGVSLRRGARATGLLAVLLALVHAVAVGWAPLTPVVLAVWICYALALPDGRLDSVRRAVAAASTAGLVAWAVALAVGNQHRPATAAFTAAALSAALVCAGFASMRLRVGTVDERRVLQWLAAASAVATGFGVVVVGLRALTGTPSRLEPWLLIALVAIPLGQLLSATVAEPHAASFALVESTAASTVAAVVALVYLVIVVGIVGSPRGHERSVLEASLVAAVVVALLAVPARHRVVRAMKDVVGGPTSSPTEALGTFGARMSRAVPMDELLLQLAETLRDTIAGAGAEIWTGSNGVLTRTVSVPSRAADRVVLGERERLVVGRARIGGPAWTAVWLPKLFEGDSGGELGDHRVVPIAHLGELLGLVLVRRSPEGGAFAENDEVALVELARQLGLALHNVQLDSALQASLAELADRNEELQASRLRIVTAADSSRRAIERNLHDGAQQHLVALAVKLGLARQIGADGDTEALLALLEDLRVDVQSTIAELRELAHGIFPPLLRDRGLPEALRTASARAVLPCTVEVDLPGRYPEEAETATYFCCLEAIQNAGKYAGDGASLAVRVSGDEVSLRFELADDGVGFDPDTTERGHGFMNMQDRLGAIGGVLTIESAPGSGTTVRARIPSRPLAAAALRSTV